MGYSLLILYLKNRLCNRMLKEVSALGTWLTMSGPCSESAAQVQS